MAACITSWACALHGADPDSQPQTTLQEIFSRFGTKVSTRRDARYLWVESDGLPAHRMMVGITAWQQQVPLPQRYTGSNGWPIPIHPVPAKLPISAKEHFFRGAIAIAANGIPIFNPIKNDGRTDTFLAGELDEFGGHCGRADDYHYHVAPTHLQSLVGKGNPIAVALDGYPILGLTEPDGTAPSHLDDFNGHETPGLGYHYHATRHYPYINGGFHGEVTERGGQVEPQASANPVRPALPPLRGAVIVGFSNRDDRAFQLDVRVGKVTNVVRYVVQAQGTVDFDFIDAQGPTRHASYSLSGRRGGGAGGNDGQRRRRRGGDAEEGNPEPPQAQPPDDDPRPGPSPSGGRRGGGPRRDEAQAGQPRQPWLRVHAKEMDQDADGVLTRAEVDAEVQRTMGSLDANADGVIALAERRGGPGGGSAMGGFVDQHWDEVDANSDGRVSKEELADVATRMFRRGDADGDGRVSEAELKAMVAGGGRKAGKAAQ